MRGRHPLRHFGGARLLALLAALVGPVPAFASHWITVGSNGGPDNPRRSRGENIGDSMRVTLAGSSAHASRA